MKKILFAIAFHSIGMAALKAQQIKGIVKDEQGNTISNATVSLLKAKDSSVIKLELSKEGNFSFKEVEKDSLLLTISYVGYETYYSDPFRNHGETILMPVLKLNNIKTSLQAITVTAKKKLVEVKADKTILNVEGTINSTGGDALDLLRKSPGVTIDNDENLSVNGKNGVQVYIDNKPSPLNGQDLSSYLKSIPSAQIEAIEIIHNPGVMYEASRSAGIINIRLKKNKSMGFNGSVNAGISASENYRWEDGFSLSYRNKNVNVYGSYNGNYGKLKSEFELNRVIKDTAFNQQNKIQLTKENHVFKTGLDYSLSSKSNLGVTISTNISSPEVSIEGTTPISYFPTGTVDKILVAGNDSKQRNTNINSNINYSYKGEKGKTLMVNADYGYFNNKQDQTQPNTFFDRTGKNELFRKNYLIVSPTRIDIYSLKADYEQNLGKGKLSIGGKFGYVKTGNDFKQYDENGKDWKLDKDRSNFFAYKENVNAGYINYSQELKGFVIQGGVRAEQTNIKSTLRNFRNTGNEYVEETSTFKKDYLDFFPSINITLAPKTKNQFSIGYSRRIDRPVYQNLNPFEYRINEFTYHKGSIDLRPQYSNSISVTHTYKFKLNTTLSYSHVKDLFGQLIDTAQGIKGYMVNSNISTQNITSLNLSYPFKYKKYSLFTNINSFYSSYKADYGTNRDINLDVWAVHIYAQNGYSFGKGWSGELSGFYASPSIWQGTIKASSMWSADAGVQKQLWDGKATVKASVNDIFKSMKWSGTSKFAGQDLSTAGRFESRQFKLNFTYHFGNQKLKAAYQHKTGLEEETKRAKVSAGLGQQ
jgi:hypothetical protein